MFGRQVAAALHSSANARLITPAISSFTIRLSIRVAPVAHRRFYATPGRPKKAVGEASKPIKRTAKKATAESTTTTKAAAQKKPKKPKAKKAAAAKKPKTALTEEQLAVKKQKTSLLKIRELKKVALKPPHVAIANAYNQFVYSRKEDLAQQSRDSSSTPRDVLAAFSKDTAQAWKALPSSEVEVCP